jgi:hypothetical protein
LRPRSRAGNLIFARRLGFTAAAAARKLEGGRHFPTCENAEFGHYPAQEDTPNAE